MALLISGRAGGSAALCFAGGRYSPAVDSQLSRLTSAIDSRRSAGDCNQSAVFLFCGSGKSEMLLANVFPAPSIVAVKLQRKKLKDEM